MDNFAARNKVLRTIKQQYKCNEVAFINDSTYIASSLKGMNIKRTINQRIWKLGKSLCFVSLLLVYLLSSFNTESIHRLVHSHESGDLHTAQHEADPCHIKIYHHERPGGCDHKAHLVKEEKCSFCPVQLSNFQVIEECTISLIQTFESVEGFTSDDLFITTTNFKFAGRAPPVV